MAAKFLWFVGYVKVVTVFKTNHDICCRLSDLSTGNSRQFQFNFTLSFFLVLIAGAWVSFALLSTGM